MAKTPSEFGQISKIFGKLKLFTISTQFQAKVIPPIVEDTNHLVSLFANELTFYLVKVGSCVSYELTFSK